MFHDWVTGPNWAIKSWIVGCSLCVHTQTTERSTKRRLFWPNADANNRKIHEASAVPAGRGSKQPRDPRSVGCSGRPRMQTAERTAKCRLFRSNAEANNRENREVSAVPAGRRCKQPRNQRSAGCSGRMRMQTADIVHEQRLFRHRISIRGRLFSERPIVGSSWR